MGHGRDMDSFDRISTFALWLAIIFSVASLSILVRMRMKKLEEKAALDKKANQIKLILTNFLVILPQVARKLSTQVTQQNSV